MIGKQLMKGSNEKCLILITTTNLLQQAAIYGQLFKTNDDEERFKKTDLFAKIN